MGPLQTGLPLPTMIPKNWNLIITDLKNWFFNIHLHPDDAPQFAFSVPSISRKAPLKRYHWVVLPQRMKILPRICQWYMAKVSSPIWEKHPHSHYFSLYRWYPISSWKPSSPPGNFPRRHLSRAEPWIHCNQGKDSTASSLEIPWIQNRAADNYTSDFATKSLI